MPLAALPWTSTGQRCELAPFKGLRHVEMELEFKIQLKSAFIAVFHRHLFVGSVYSFRTPGASSIKTPSLLNPGQLVCFELV